MSTTTIESQALSQSDRCDSCGAQALIRVVLPYGELLFCGHHFTKHAPTLRPQALRIDDFTEVLIGSSS